MYLLWCCLLNLICWSAWADGSAKVAVVSVIRGEVTMTMSQASSTLKKDDWVNEGAVVKTADKSFVKLVFVDKSQMNIGPNSEMKIAKFTGKDSGIIDLVKGQVRSQVTKDYLQMKDKDKSKIFVKTPNAVMGVRGTDFMITTRGPHTTAILFEGSVVFAKAEDLRGASSDRLEDIVNQGVRLHPGEFSVVEQGRSRATEPAMLNIEQREKLEQNVGAEGAERTPSNENTQANEKGSQETNKAPERSVVPVGLTGLAVSNQTDTIKTEVGEKIQTPQENKEQVDGQNENRGADGFVKGEVVKPANGSFVHLESGTIIPPGAGSVLDSNTNTYIPGPNQGSVSREGEYVPPKNVQITSEGKMFVSFRDEKGGVRNQEIEKPLPVAATNGVVNLNNLSHLISQNPQLQRPGTPLPNDIFNPAFNPNGLVDYSNLKLNNSGTQTLIETQVIPKARTIIINGP